LVALVTASGLESLEESARLRALGHDVKARGRELGLGLRHARVGGAIDLVFAGFVDELPLEVCVFTLGHNSLSSKFARGQRLDRRGWSRKATRTRSA
jgi:hypothetical protein